MYGSQLAREMGSRSSGYFQLKGGTVYPALYRLEQDGLVESSWWEKYRGGPTRRVYSITPDGRDRLSAMLGEWKNFSEAVGLIYRSASNATS